MTAPVALSDSLVAPLLLELRDCLGRELARSVTGPVCRVTLTHSMVSPTMEGCGCACEPDGQGDAWVRLVRLEPDASLIEATPGCPVAWQAVVELGVYRCVPISEEGGLLDAADVTDTALAALADMNALLRVLACCPALRDRDAVVDLWQPIGPSGGCAGGALQFHLPINGRPAGC